jgi:hypothetical protein
MTQHQPRPQQAAGTHRTRRAPPSSARLRRAERAQAVLSGGVARAAPMWLWRAVAALSAAADSAAARAAAAAGCSPRALKAGLGTALAIVALHRLLALRREASRATGDAVASGAAPPGSQSRLPAPAPSRAPPSAPPAAPSGAPPALSRVSLATAGILFSGPPGVLPEGLPTLAARAASALAVLAAVTDVYLITQLAPGDGAAAAEAAAREVLAAAGVLGSGPGAVPAHRALFCTTHVGRIALARQARAHCRAARAFASSRACVRGGLRALSRATRKRPFPPPSAGCRGRPR